MSHRRRIGSTRESRTEMFGGGDLGRVAIRQLPDPDAVFMPQMV